MKSTKVLRFSFPAKWGALNPAQQNTAIGSMILSAQYNSLVRFNAKGLIEPDLALSWKVNDAFTKYTFYLDINRMFSDGTFLRAANIKSSWEEGLSQESKSSNHSMSDIMYLVEGYDDFKATGVLRGVRVISDSELEVTFVKPFRLALDHFSGVRFGITKKVDSSYLGTGPYQITKMDENVIEMIPNKFYPEGSVYEKLEIYYLPYPKDLSAIKAGIIDVAMGHFFLNIPECDEAKDNLACVTGQEASHLVLPLNGLDKRIFNDKNLRLAFQYLVKSEFKKSNEWEKFFVQGFELDSQIFLPVQAGRLSDDEVNKIVLTGKNYVDDLIKISRKSPITFYSKTPCSLIKDVFVKNGIYVKEFFEGDNGLDWMKVYYKTFDTDLLIMSLSIAHGDPDGAYHALGSTGAISSKMTYRPAVGDLLEQGRSLAQIEKLDEHYKKVNRAILEEVPFIHLGFTRRLFIFDKNKIKINDAILHRRGIDFNVFERL